MKAPKGRRAAGAAGSVAALGLALVSSAWAHGSPGASATVERAPGLATSEVWSAPVSRAEMILAEGPKKKAAEPQRDKSRNRPVHVREDAQLGSGRKIGSDKGGVSNQNPISGAPSKGNKPPTGSSRPGGMDVSVDPSARPKPGTLERGKAFEGLPGQKPVDSRLTDRAADPKGRVQETGDSRLQDPRSGGGAGSAALKPGDTRYGSKESMIGQDATGTPQNRITSDHVGNVPEIGKSLQNLSGTAARPWRCVPGMFDCSSTTANLSASGARRCATSPAGSGSFPPWPQRGSPSCAARRRSLP